MILRRRTSSALLACCLALLLAVCGGTPLAAQLENQRDEPVAARVTFEGPSIEPLFWQTLWFRVLAGLLVVGGMAAGLGARAKGMAAHTRALQIQVGERTHEIEQHRQELAALFKADEELYGHLELDPVLNALVKISVDVLNADKSAVLTWDRSHEHLGVRVARGFSRESIEHMSFVCGKGLAARVAETGEPAVVENAPEDPLLADEPEGALRALAAEGIRSLLHLPITVRDQVFGVFCVAYCRAHAFGEDQQRLFAALAQRAARAIENADYYSAEHRRAEQFRVLAQVGHQATVLADVDTALARVARLIRESFGYYHVGIGLIEGDEVVYRVGAGVLWDDPVFGFQPQRLKVGSEGLTGWVAGSGQPLLVPDVRKDPRYVWMQGSATLSEVTVPIIIAGRVAGVLDAQSDQFNAFDETDLSVMQSLANQVAVTIENARHHDAEHRRAEQFRTINDVGQRINAILPVADLLEQIAPLVQGAFDYSHVAIGLVEGDEVVARAEAGIWGKIYGSAKLKVGKEGVWGWVAATGEPLLIPDVRLDSRYYWLPSAPDVRAMLCVPLKAKDRIIGVLSTESERLNAFDESDLAVLQSLANQAAIAIENARLYEAERNRVTQLTALQETTRAVASTLEQDALLRQIIQQATSLLRGDGGLINLVDWDEREDEVVAAIGAATDLLGGRGSLDSSLSGWVTLQNQPIIAGQLLTDSRIAREALDWLAERNIESVAAAPLAVKDRVIGTLIVLIAGSAKGAFQQSDLDLLVAFANQAAVAIENARLYEQAQRLAVVEERGRIARDLHDAVTQTLFSASLISEALPAIWASDRTEGEQLLQELRQLSRGALAEMRTLLLELRPAALMEADLGDLLRQLAEAAAGRAGVKMTVRIDGKDKLPDEVHVALYRIAQEALNNVVKHARATEVDLVLRRSVEPAGTQESPEEAGEAAGGLKDLAGTPRARRESVELIVQDNGRGFDPEDIPPDHLGLGIIRERAQAIGAELDVQSAPGKGTRVRVKWKS